MQLVKIVNAYMAVEYLMNREWDYQTAYTFWRLKKHLTPHAEFFAKEERKLIEEYAKKEKDGKIKIGDEGTFTFRDEAAGVAYTNKRRELCNVEICVEWEEVTVPAPEKIRPIHLEALEGFITFGR